MASESEALREEIWRSKRRSFGDTDDLSTSTGSRAMRTGVGAHWLAWANLSKGLAWVWRGCQVGSDTHILGELEINRKGLERGRTLRVPHETGQGHRCLYFCDLSSTSPALSSILDPNPVLTPSV